ncbi:hypothetical protein [Achromobacter insuavis]|uniref:hypothetical protein n=2 Tax=Achromobacter insuavis TaxID=1287735 RepID=UPI0029DDC98B|nr:hypothetical protein [Achromobacter sp.]MCG2602441.1 hypothetical protein [Achromobacter sp.]
MSFFTHRWKRIPVVFVMASTLAISGCASTGSSFLNKGAQPDPRLTQGSDAKFFSQSGLQACMLGMAAGLALGLLAGSKDKKAESAIGGAIAACGVAMGANYYLDVRRDQYKNTSDQLLAMSNDIKADTQKVQNRGYSITAVMTDDKFRLEQIQSAIKAKTLVQATARTDLARIDANIKVIKSDLNNMNNLVKQYREVGAKTGGSVRETAEMQKQIAELDGKIAQLNQEADSYFALRGAIDLGEQKV